MAAEFSFVPFLITISALVRTSKTLGPSKNTQSKKLAVLDNEGDQY